MNALKQLYEALPTLLPTLASAAMIAGGLWLANWVLLRRHPEMDAEKKFPRRIAMLLFILAGIVLVILSVPVETTAGQEARSQVLRLFGLLLTAVIAFSSTTFVANGMAGLMLRLVNSFRPGDFIDVEGKFGRVTARGLLHTEIQTEDHNLATLPNLYLVSHPVKVVHSSRTVVSATVSLGYDNPHGRIESLLTEAAGKADLEDPFVQITDLGDFSVTYRAAGFLKDVKQILTARSLLRAMMLDVLHSAGVEIVSPTFMNQRRLGENVRAVPSKGKARKSRYTPSEDRIPEELIFDKAERAERIEKLRQLREDLSDDVKGLETRIKNARKVNRPALQEKLERLNKRCEAVTKALEMLEQAGVDG